MVFDNVTTGGYIIGMRAIGVKQLKARLSEYLRLVKTGEVVLVTDHDQVVAELRPARRQSAEVTESQELLQELAERGEVELPSRWRSGWRWQVTGLGLESGTAQKLLDELRSE